MKFYMSIVTILFLILKIFKNTKLTSNRDNDNYNDIKNNNSSKTVFIEQIRLNDNITNFSNNTIFAKPKISSVILNFTCSIKHCQTPYGYCKSNSKCKCFGGYAHVPLLDPGLCHYSQYSSSKTLILEIIFPGFGCIYLGRYIWGLMKILLVPGVYHIWQNTNTEKFCNCFLISLVGYAIIFLHLRDLFLILANTMTDHNDIQLYKSLY